MRRVLIAVAALTVFYDAASWAQSGPGERLFQRCAACHLPSGQGVPETFPPLDMHLGRIAADPKGRQYLIMVLTKGLTGPLKVNGRPYNGFMPRQNLSAAEEAAVLNHVLATFAGRASPQGWKPFDEAEVASTRKALDHLQPGELATLRPGAAK
ncbi:MAG: cytochrome c, class [Bradyrhizobium sp.]|nr:cytochrome c, class [Bradyrhizobium sp.]